MGTFEALRKGDFDFCVCGTPPQDAQVINLQPKLSPVPNGLLQTSQGRRSEGLQCQELPQPAAGTTRQGSAQVQTSGWWKAPLSEWLWCAFFFFSSMFICRLLHVFMCECHVCVVWCVCVRFIWFCVCVCFHVNAFVFVHVCICVYVFVYVCVCVHSCKHEDGCLCVLRWVWNSSQITIQITLFWKVWNQCKFHNCGNVLKREFKAFQTIHSITLW